MSHVGKIRANNQDSGYAGRWLFIVADGMGGHAGGDIASAIALGRVLEADREYDTAEEAERALKSALLEANNLLAETVLDHRELTGMGTTVSSLLRVGDRVVLAHIGDSRIYRFSDARLEQISSDHTFVQRLVDSGRITAEEAAVHPRRSVLMRVLGDVDAAPEIDTAILDARPGDRWLICSDGLSSYVPEEKIEAILRTVHDTGTAAQRLVKESLDQGAPDNVTVAVLDVEDGYDPAGDQPITVGSAATPLSFEVDTDRPSLRLPTLLLHPLKATQPDPSHFEPESDEYLDELILEDRRRAIRRRISWAIGIVLVIAAVAVAAVLGYRWTQDHYFVGADDDGMVAIYQGVQQDLGPLKLSHVYQETGIDLADLPEYTRESVERTISAKDLADAQAIVERLADAEG